MTQNEDKLFQEIFSGYKPALSSDDAFMDALTKKMDKVEYIKTVQEAHIRHYKMAVVLSLVCGIIVGGVFSVLIMLIPLDVPLFTLTTTNTLLLTLQQHSRLLSVLLLSGLTSWGIISMVGMIQELNCRDRKTWAHLPDTCPPTCQ